MTSEAPPPPEESRPAQSPPPGGQPAPPPPPSAWGGGAPPPSEGYGAPPPAPGGYGAPQGSAPQYGAPQHGMPQYGAGPGAPLSPQDERTWGMLAHLSALVAAFVALSFLGPLIVMLTQGNRSQFVRRQAVEALNFQITIYIAGIISALLLFVLIGFLLLPIVGIAWLVFTIIGAMKANNGEDYRYSVNLRLVK